MKRDRRLFPKPRQKKNRCWKGQALRLCVICARGQKTCAQILRRRQTQLRQMTDLRSNQHEKTTLASFFGRNDTWSSINAELRFTSGSHWIVFEGGIPLP